LIVAGADKAVEEEKGGADGIVAEEGEGTVAAVVPAVAEEEGETGDGDGDGEGAEEGEEEEEAEVLE
jgi:hypothetical protein